MSTERFIELLQELLTMVDPGNALSIACVKNTLQNIFALAQDSGKTSRITLRMMEMAIYEANYLINSRDDFAGKPGDYYGNKAKRKHLSNVITPGC